MSALTEKITSWQLGQSLRLPLSEFGGPAIQELGSFAGENAWLEISGFELDPASTDHRALIRGIGQSPPFQDFRMELEIQSGGNGLQLRIEANFDREWRFSDSFPELNQSYVDRFPYSSARMEFPGAASEPGLWFHGALSLASGRLAFLSLFGDLLPQLHGRIRKTEVGFDFRLEHAFNFPLDLKILHHGSFTLGLRCHSSTLEANAQGRPIFIGGRQVSPSRQDGSGSDVFQGGYFFLETQLDITIEGTEISIPLEARLHNPRHDIMARAYLRELSEFSLEAIGNFIGKSIPLPDFLPDLSLSDLLSLKYIEIQLSPWLPDKLSRLRFVVETSRSFAIPVPDPENSILGLDSLQLNLDFINPLNPSKSEWLIHLAGGLRVGESGKLQLATSFSQNRPKPIIAGQLSDGHPLKIGELIRHLSQHDGTDLPALEVDELRFYLDTNTTQWEFVLSIHDLWTIPSGEKELGIHEITIHCHHLPGEPMGIDLGAIIWIGSCRVVLEASHPAEKGGGWFFEGQLMDDGELNLAYLFAHLANSTHFSWPDHFPDIFIREIDVSYHTKTRDFSFHALSTVDAPIGDFKEDLFLDVSLDVAATHDAQENTHLEIDLAARMRVADQQFEVRTSLSKEEQVLYAAWSHDTDGLHLARLLEMLDATHREETSSRFGLDLTLNALAFEYVHTTAEHDLLFSARTREGLDLYVVGQKRSGWRFLINLEFDQVGQGSSSLPEAIARLLEPVFFFDLRKVSLAVSTGKFENFSFPDLPEIRTGDQPQPLAGATKLDMDAGLYLHAEINLAQSDNPAAGILPDDHLLFTAAVDWEHKSAHLEVDYAKQIALAGTGENQLALEEVKFSLEVPDLALRLHGEAELCLDHTPVRLKGGILLDKQELQASLNVEFEKGGLQFFGVEGLFLDSLGALVGVAFEPVPGLELGLFGTMHLGDEDEGADAVGILLALEGDIPVPKLLELRIEELDFGAMVDLIVGDALPGGSAGLEIKAENVHLFWSAVETDLPDGRHVQPSFSFACEFDILGWKAFAALSASPDAGLAGLGVCKAIVLGGILTISGGSKGYWENRHQNAHGRWVKVPDTGLGLGVDAPSAEVVWTEVVPGGGPEFIFSTFDETLLHLDLEVSIFNFLKEKVSATFSTGRIEFELGFEAGDIAGLHLHFGFDQDDGFDAKADCHIKLGGVLDVHLGEWEIGTINLSLGVDASISLGFSKEKGLWFNVHFEADLFGWKLGPFDLELAAKITDLAQLPGELLREVEENILQSLEDLWRFLFDRDNFLAEQQQAAAEARRKEVEAENERFRAEFEQHHQEIAQQAASAAQEAFAQARAIRDRAQLRFYADMDRAMQYLGTADPLIATLEDRLREIPQVDPHHEIRKADIENWNRDAEELQTTSRKRSVGPSRAETILQKAREMASQSRAGAHAYSSKINPNHG